MTIFYLFLDESGKFIKQSSAPVIVIGVDIRKIDRVRVSSRGGAMYAINKGRKALSLIFVTTLIAGISPSFAQEAAAQGPEPIEEIVITGSRIARRDFVAVSPIVTVDAALIQASGSVTLEETLNEMPQLVPSANASADLSPRSGQASANLRGLGYQRTLVLVDGRRIQPASGNGAADLNMIPPGLIRSVEVITGGASAIYGSDAVTGVINVKLRKDVEGIEIRTQHGMAEEGDGFTQDYNLLVGGNFDEGQGNGFLSLSYSNRESVLSADRRYFGRYGASTSLPQGYWVTDATNLATQAATDAVFDSYGYPAGTVSRTTRLYFNTDGTLFTGSGPDGPRNYRDGFDGLASNLIVNPNNSLRYDSDPFVYIQKPLDRTNVFARSEYTVSPNLTVFAQGDYLTYETTANRLPNVQGSFSSFIPLTIPITNPFISPDLASLLASRPQPDDDFGITKRSAENTPIFQRFNYDVFEVVVGASGNFASDNWTWDAYGSYGETAHEESQIDYASNVALNNLLDAPDGGTSICDGGWNPFGLHAMSRSCLDYVNRTTHSTVNLDQYIFQFNVQGSLFELPAGETQLAAGVEYRKNNYTYEPDALISTGELAGYLPIQATAGSTDVQEIYAEFLVPLTARDSAIRETNLDVAYRYSDYDSIGGTSTYKADLDWIPYDGLRIRGGYSKAIRAPSAGELFAPEAIGNAGFGAPGAAGSGDACDIRSYYRSASNPDSDLVRSLCLEQGLPAALIDTYMNVETSATLVTGGNVELQEEAADTYSIGAIFQISGSSAWFSDFSVSLDYYSIKIDAAVGTVTSGLAMQRCFNSDGSNPTLNVDNFYCTLISRDPGDGDPSLVQNPLFNLGGYKTSGVDLSIDWHIPLAEVGLGERSRDLVLSSFINRLDKFEIQTLDGTPFVDYAGTIGNSQIEPYATARPDWKAITTFKYLSGPLDVALRWRYLGRMENSANVGTGGTLPATKSVSYFDLNGGYNFTDDIAVRLGVVNLLNQDPPVTSINSQGIASTDATTYDVIGRRYFVQFNVDF